MSATVVASQLRLLVERTQGFIAKLSNIHPTNDQWSELDSLSLRLSEAASRVRENTVTLKHSHTERAWQESEKHRTLAQSATGDLLANQQLNNPVIFRRNIILIFEGPKDSSFDSTDVKLRKASTRKRCGIIRGLSPDGVISWAIAYTPTLWAGGSMASDIFDCLVDDIEPELVQTWPPMIRDTLHKLKNDEESLQKSPEYGEFLKTIDDPSDRRENPVRHRKRRRIEEEHTQTQQSDQPHQAQQLAHTDEMDKRPPNTDGLRRCSRDRQIPERPVEVSMHEPEASFSDIHTRHGGADQGNSLLTQTPRNPPAQVMNRSLNPHNTTLQARPADHADVLYLKFTELLSFLQQYRDSRPKLHFVCPWGGVPLPSVNITLESALGLSAKIELSVPFCEALMKYILALGSATAKVSH